MIRLVLYLAIISSCMSCQQDTDEVLFSLLDEDESGIKFVNTLVDSPDFNIIEYLYYYNGGGVAAGDLNNDGMVDLYFTGNQVDDALYINQGDLKFVDQSVESGVIKYSGWSTGVTMVDINGDGWLDIYVCRLGRYKMYNDHNRLFINQKDGSFEEQSAAYGLDFSGFGTQACFFDYDRDGDLDCYLLNHSVKRPDQFVAASKIRDLQDSLSGDRLMRNDDGLFVDVSAAAGVLSSIVGFGLGVASADINNDGWQDIYIGNDFHENDYLYVNNQDGTFADIAEQSLGHSSNFTMGTTIADINSDGLLDILSLDMLPDDEIVFKMSGGWENMQIYDFKRSYGYHHQSPENALQINLGNVSGNPMFSEQAAMNGLHATDWSWSPLVADFDLDGDQDIFITNGIKRRPNDMDFVNYVNVGVNQDASRNDMINQMKEGKVPNVLNVNNGSSFSTSKMGDATISNGACLADLDNDGDWDIVTNNIDQVASIWINKTNPENYVKVRLIGDQQNTNALGAKISVVTDPNISLSKTTQLISSSLGFQSMNESAAIFPSNDQSIMLEIIWPDGDITTEAVAKGETEHTFRKGVVESLKDEHANDTITYATLPFGNEDRLYNDQNRQPLIPYLQSNLPPRMAVSGTGEVFVSQGKGKNGYVIPKDSSEVSFTINKQSSEMFVDETDAAFFDADGDGDQDLYVAIGGMELENGNPLLMDRLYFNEDGQYLNSDSNLPLIGMNTSAVAPYDYDQDGDVDLFVGVQGAAHQYGKTEDSYLLENIDNQRFEPRSIDLKAMVYDGEWADMDGDGRGDLVVVGHWMPITIFYSRSDGFVREEIPYSEGLWFTVLLCDVDDDGSIDILAGNYGENHRIGVDRDHPLRLYRSDFDNNFTYDPIITYVRDGVEYPYANLDLLLKQLPSVKKKYQRHSDYSDQNISQIFSLSELEAADRLEVNTLSSQLFRRRGKKWQGVALPRDLQLAPIWTFSQWKDGFVAGGNLYDIDPNWGRQDALPLTLVRFDEDGVAEIGNLPILISEVRSVVSIDSTLLIAGRNNALRRLKDSN